MYRPTVGSRWPSDREDVQGRCAAQKFELRSGLLKAAPVVIAGSGFLMQFFLGIFKLKHCVLHSFVIE